MVERYGGAPMSVVRESVVVDAPVEDVWRIVSDPRNLPRWNPHIRSVHGVPDGGLRPGDTYVTVLRILGVKVRVDARVLAIEPPRRSEIHLSGPLDAVVRTHLRPVGTSRTRLDHDVEYHLKGGPVGELIGRAVRIVGAPTLLRRGVRAQQRQIEGR